MAKPRTIFIHFSMIYVPFLLEFDGTLLMPSVPVDITGFSLVLTITECSSGVDPSQRMTYLIIQCGLYDGQCSKRLYRIRTEEILQFSELLT
ncbi:hypothetical protein TNCV_4287851 [Trichonephila clavipes]|uniref:Uncharacterized protein n=1 Tax=Trichonephila clavipes TaxID=2585209 RepID=A0A8X6VCS7_TRICX|nr:hypothetical protein TNCV_4287851 [Trichonephila clavipes]